MNNSKTDISGNINYSFSNRQIAFLIFCTIVGFGIMRLPRDAIQEAHTGAWVPLLMNMIMSIIVGYMFVYLGLNYEGKSIEQYSEKIVGKIGSKMIMFLFFIYYYIFIILEIRLIDEVIIFNFMINTPSWALALLFNGVAFFAIYKKLNIIAMLCELYGVIMVIGFFIMTFLAFSQGRLIYMQPFFNMKDIGIYLKSIPKFTTTFVGVEILAIIPLYKRNNNNRYNNNKVFGSVVKILMLIGLLYILLVESSLSVVGEDSIIVFEDSLMATIRRIELPFLDFLQRLDGLVFSIYLSGVMTTIIVMGYAAVYFVSKLLKVPDNQYGRLVFILAILSQVICMLPITSDLIEKYFTYHGYVLGGICALIIPLLLIIIQKVRKYAEKV